MARTKKTGQKGLLPIHRQKQKLIDDIRKAYESTKDETKKLQVDAMQGSLEKSIARHKRRTALANRKEDRKERKIELTVALMNLIEESDADEEVEDTESDSEIFGEPEKPEDTGPDDDDSAGGGMGGDKLTEIKC